METIAYDSLVLGRKVWMRQAGIGWGQFTITQVPKLTLNDPNFFFCRDRSHRILNPSSAAPVVDVLLHSAFVQDLLDRGDIRESPPWVTGQE